MSDDTPSDEPMGFSLDIGKILRDVTAPPKRTRKPTGGSRRTATRRTTASASSSDMDAAMRRAVRAELDDVKRALKDLAEEIVRLRRANEDLADKVARLGRG